MITNSAIVVVPGLVLIAITFNKTMAAKLESKAAMYFWGVVGGLALIFAFVN